RPLVSFLGRVPPPLSPSLQGGTVSDAAPAFRLLPVALSLALASSALADDPEPVPNPEPYIDLVHLPSEIDPGSGERLFICDLDGDHDPDVVLLAGGTVY